MLATASITATAWDNVAVLSLVIADQSSSGCSFAQQDCQIAVGSYDFLATATDLAGNTADCAFTVTVQDMQPPQIGICPASFVVSTDQNSGTAAISWTAPIAWDNVEVTSFTETIDGSAYTGYTVTLDVGVHDVSYAALDAAGNSAVCDFAVTVVDGQAPVFQDCPASITQSTDSGVATAVVTWNNPDPTDNVAVTTTTQTAWPGDTFPLGATQVQYIAWDAAGNMAVCQFTVTIVDTESPVIHNCPSDITQSADPGEPYATVAWIVPTETDNVGATLTDSAEPGSTFPFGVTTAVYMVTDAAGNSAVCTFSITVTDTEPPMIAGCPSNIMTVTDQDKNYATVTWTAPVITDNVDQQPDVWRSAESGDHFVFGTTNVVITATDLSGNAATCTFTVTVTDGQAPTYSNCPADIQTSTDLDLATATVWWTAPTATDNVQVLSETSTAAPGDSFALGLTTVTYTATGASDLVATCTFDVTVADNQPPTFTNCPASQTLISTLGESVQGTWNLPTAWDNSGSAQISGTVQSGTYFEVGQSSVIFVAVDPAGNNAICQFSIIVVNACAGVVCTNQNNICLAVPTCFNGTCPIAYADNTPCTPTDPRGTNGLCTLGSCVAQGFIASFGTQSYVSLPTMQDIYSTSATAWECEVSFQFRTINSEGSLFTIGNTEPGRNYLRIYLLGGALHAEMQLGTGVGNVSTAGIVSNLNTGKWQQVVFSKLNAHGNLQVNGNNFRFTTPGDAHTLKVFGPVAKYNVIIGAIPGNYVAAIASGTAASSTAQSIPVSESFQGCMQSLWINGASVGLSQAVAGPGFAASNDVLQCAPNKPVTIPSFAGISAFMSFPTMVEHFNSTVAAMQISITFSTSMQNGILLWNRAVHMPDFITVYLLSGGVALTFNLGTGAATAIAPCNMCSFGDGSQHTVTVNLLNAVGSLSVDGGTWFSATAPGGTRVLNADQPLFLGGLSPTEFAAATALGINPQGFGGCMQAVLVDGHAIVAANNISAQGVCQCGQEPWYQSFEDPVPLSVCDVYESQANPIVYPAPVQSCLLDSGASLDSRTWLYENDGFYRCRSDTAWFSNCTSYP